jgi:cell division control protein 6
MRELQEKEKILLVALDDVNHILKDNNGQEIFFELLRAYEMFNVKIGVFLILTSLEFRYKFDKDIRTVFIPQEIIFPHYTLEETYAILKERVSIGFHDKVINQEILLKVSELSLEAKNIILGLQILHTLGVLAENEENHLITIEHLNQLIKTQKNTYKKTVKFL